MLSFRDAPNAISCLRSCLSRSEFSGASGKLSIDNLRDYVSTTRGLIRAQLLGASENGGSHAGAPRWSSKGRVDNKPSIYKRVLHMHSSLTACYKRQPRSTLIGPAANRLHIDRSKPIGASAHFVGSTKRILITTFLPLIRRRVRSHGHYMYVKSPSIRTHGLNGRKRTDVCISPLGYSSFTKL